jgi:membrane associated rhomboid family serine protease
VIPLGDRLRRRRRPLITLLLLLVLAAAFAAMLLLAPPATEALLARFALVPARLAPLLAGDLAAAPQLLRLGSSLLLHAGLLHLLGNLLFLWVFGRGVESRLGTRLLAFFLLCGAVAGLVHVLVDPGSTVPTIGASGAISGVMGAYLALHPRARLRTLVIVVVVPVRVEVSAWLWLLLWIALQLLAGSRDLLAGGPAAGGVAWWAHVGGFAAGLALARLFARR